MLRHKITIITISFLAVLALAYPIEQLIYDRTIIQPLTDELLQMTDIESITVKGPRGKKILEVILVESANLQQAYSMIETTASKYLQDNLSIIELKDRRNELLQSIYNRFNFSIQEAIMTGNFSVLEEHFQTILEDEPRPIRYNLYVDFDNVYIQIEDGKYILYEIEQRRKGERDNEPTGKFLL